MTPERRGLLLVVGAALLWSTGGVGIKGVEASAITVSFYRSIIGAATLLMLFRPARPRLTRALVAAIVSYAGCVTTFVMATKWTTAANAIFLQYSGIVWVILLSPLLLGERMTPRDRAAVVVTMIGMGLFFADRLEVRGLAGSLVALLSGLFFAGIFLALRFTREQGSESAVIWGNVLAAVVAAPWAVTQLEVPARSALLLVFLGVFQIGLAYALLVRGLAHVTATRAFLTGMLEPVCNPVWVFLLLGERPGPFSLAGGTVVIGAILWRSLGGAPPPAA